MVWCRERRVKDEYRGNWGKCKKGKKIRHQEDKPPPQTSAWEREQEVGMKWQVIFWIRRERERWDRDKRDVPGSSSSTKIWEGCLTMSEKTRTKAWWDRAKAKDGERVGDEYAQAAKLSWLPSLPESVCVCLKQSAGLAMSTNVMWYLPKLRVDLV